MSHYSRFGFGCYESSLSIWIRCYERFIIGLDSLLWEIHYRIGFVVMRDSSYISIWILSPAVYIYRRSELTADSFHSLYVAFPSRSFSPTNIRRPFLLPCDFVAASPVYSYGGNADLIPIIGWPEMNHITITGSYYALIYYRRCNILFLPAKTVTFHPLPSDFTVGLNWRRIHSLDSLDVSFFNCSYLSTNIPVHSYSLATSSLLRWSILTAAMLGLRSVNEWKHGATRSAVTREQSEQHDTFFMIRLLYVSFPLNWFSFSSSLLLSPIVSLM
jgi:hypothetical protein